jgi:hypothetical protein
VESNYRDDDLLNTLYQLSGDPERKITASNLSLVISSLRNERDDVRERAIFIGGLRWAHEVILGYFVGALSLKLESSDDNCRLMIESLVSWVLQANDDREMLIDFLVKIKNSAAHDSLTAKSSYVGIKRLRGEMTKQQFAVVDYDEIVVPFE